MKTRAGIFRLITVKHEGSVTEIANGLVTYDRRLVKINSARIRDYIRKHFEYTRKNKAYKMKRLNLLVNFIPACCLTVSLACSRHHARIVQPGAGHPDEEGSHGARRYGRILPGAQGSRRKV